MFVAFHTETTRYLRVFSQGYWQDARYEDKGSCTRAINKAAARGEIKAEEYSSAYRRIQENRED